MESMTAPAPRRRHRLVRCVAGVVALIAAGVVTYGAVRQFSGPGGGYDAGPGGGYGMSSSSHATTNGPGGGYGF